MKSDPERIKPESHNHALVLGRYFVDRSPLNELKRLRATLSYCPAIGHYIPISKDDRKRINDCISYNEGGQN